MIEGRDISAQEAAILEKEYSGFSDRFGRYGIGAMGLIFIAVAMIRIFSADVVMLDFLSTMFILTGFLLFGLIHLLDSREIPNQNELDFVSHAEQNEYEFISSMNGWQEDYYEKLDNKGVSYKNVGKNL